MKAMKRELQSVVKNLKLIAEKVEKIEAKLNIPGKATEENKAAPVSPKKAVVKKAAKVTASQTLYAIIARSKKGVSSATLKKKTGFNDQKIRDNIYRLRKQNKIESIDKGVYIKA
ncbi:MAG: hypothetical protein J7L16_02830 [Deltaproteobacteria bacterium]|nr:hypothetical protein [Deltaproteobacteria bacterium]